MKYFLIVTLLVFNQLLLHGQEKQLPKGWDKIILNKETAYMNLVIGEVSKVFPEKAAEENRNIEEFDPTIVHIVKEGENLSSIARHYNLSLSNMYKLNSMSNFDELNVGTEVVLGYAANKEEKEEFFKKRGLSKYNVHKVCEGETLYSISKQYKLPVAELKRKNNIEDNTIYLGQKLKIK
ncbi:LysM repeat-containing protein [Tenacibaculum sp. MAR_2009_124]|uniref:LysM peptidoglycan-binding domain-containing protein n=1 Tax=Tenacibaculum sp. MAR_2009_124 TaxID=1250059 RepID=UPI00089A05D2|nr:LysM peptidoglycan-binding domain-containing protein [Tenacibaculum sp. MAR_2009_124]SEB38425.1 LysM repeat-containing protein [Tenacibaculum sp. MAR_2009_124]